MRRGPATLPLALAALALGACGMLDGDRGFAATAAVETANAVHTADQLTSVVSPVPSRTPTPASSPTPEPTSTAAPTQTPPAPLVSVSLATNCRSGPGESFSFRGVLETDETAQVLGRSTLPDYWFVVNPDQPDQGCWLWGGNASFEGELDTLPELTPVPSPRPAVGFQLYFWGFGTCGDQRYVILIVQNTGQQRLMSGNLHVYDSDASRNLHGPAFERHPFAETSKACPPGHGNILDPGAGAYIIIPIKSAPSGNMGYAVVVLCTEDFAGGDCESNTIYFRL